MYRLNQLFIYYTRFTVTMVKRTRKHFTYSEKKDAMDYALASTNSEAAKRYGVSATSIRDWSKEISGMTEAEFLKCKDKKSRIAGKSVNNESIGKDLMAYLDNHSSVIVTSEMLLNEYIRLEEAMVSARAVGTAMKRDNSSARMKRWMKNNRLQSESL